MWEWAPMRSRRVCSRTVVVVEEVRLMDMLFLEFVLRNVGKVSS